MLSFQDAKTTASLGKQLLSVIQFIFLAQPHCYGSIGWNQEAIMCFPDMMNIGWDFRPEA